MSGCWLHRRDEAIDAGDVWRELDSGGSHGASISMAARPDGGSPCPLLQCQPQLTPGGSGVAC